MLYDQGRYLFQESAFLDDVGYSLLSKTTTLVDVLEGVDLF